MVLWTVHIPVLNVGVTVGFARVSNLDAAIRTVDRELTDRESEGGPGDTYQPGS